MNEQREEVKEKVVQSEKVELPLEIDMSIHVPNWVNKGFEQIYRIGYTLCKNDPKTASLSSTERKKWIISKGNEIISQIRSANQK